jgi:hypothetical protein
MRWNNWLRLVLPRRIRRLTIGASQQFLSEKFDTSGYASLRFMLFGRFLLPGFFRGPAWYRMPGSVLDPDEAGAYIAGHDDVLAINRAPPPPCHHGTGALWHVSHRPHAAGFWPRHLDPSPRCLSPERRFLERRNFVRRLLDWRLN